MNFFMNLNMGKKSSLKDVQRALIVTLQGEAYMERKISEKFKCSKTAAHNATAKIFCDRKRSGRPRKTSVRDDRTMQRVVVRSPMSSCKKLRERQHSFSAIEQGICPSVPKTCRETAVDASHETEEI